MTALTDIVADAQWLCVGFNPRERLLHFLNVEPRTIEDCVFLDQRVLDFTKTTTFALADVHARLPPESDRAPPALVLHTAFCCSTLLGRCLPLPHRAQVLRELTVFAGLPAAREQIDARGWAMLVDCVAWLSSRRFADGARAINKPTNIVLPAAGELIATHSDARAVLIYSDLPGFLISNSKRAAAARPQLLAMYLALDPRADLAARQVPEGIDTLDHLQLAVLIWHFQMEVIAALDSGRLRALDAEAFLGAPESSVVAAQRWFDVAPDAAATRALLDIELKRHAKGGDIPFDADRRKHEEGIARHYFGAQVDAALRWSDARFGPWRDALPRHKPLIG